MSLTVEAVRRLDGAQEVRHGLFHIFKDEQVYLPKLRKTVPLRVRVGVIRFDRDGRILSQEGMIAKGGRSACYKRVVRPWRVKT